MQFNRFKQDKFKHYPFKYNMDDPKEIESVYWDEKNKAWNTKLIKVEEYHGFTECRYCQRPMSHNVKTDGEFKVIYVKCSCSRN